MSKNERTIHTTHSMVIARSRDKSKWMNERDGKRNRANDDGIHRFYSCGWNSACRNHANSILDFNIKWILSYFQPHLSNLENGNGDVLYVYKIVYVTCVLCIIFLFLYCLIMMMMSMNHIEHRLLPILWWDIKLRWCTQNPQNLTACKEFKQHIAYEFAFELLISIFHTVFIWMCLVCWMPSTYNKISYRGRLHVCICLGYLGIMYIVHVKCRMIMSMLSPNDKHNQYLCSFLHTFYVHCSI